ncbi:unnamed protein product [Mytilus coruscus]|uniref:RNase H type-1 domain-containing protein n=1 Tax=Mytilus coruscus TaxID=42192 RepID=A0A6J8C9G9_MYTCO|nr:unnamed protein product [Mytilus coruscus]
MDVDRSTQDVAPCRNQNKTDFIKDEYSLNFLPDNTTSVISNIESDNLTTDYYEYEQGQANIIVKDRLKITIYFGKSVVYSDASNTGYGGYIVETPFNIAHGMWSECESTKSSTWKELNAIKHILLSMVDILKDKRIKWFSDNQNVLSIVAKGSMKPDLQDIALCIFENCLTHHISIDAEWVPRTFNEKATIGVLKNNCLRI